MTSLTPGRSIVNNVLLNGDDIVKAVSLSYGYDGNDPFRAELAFTSGERNFDTNFQQFPTNGANWGAYSIAICLVIWWSAPLEGPYAPWVAIPTWPEMDPVLRITPDFCCIMIGITCRAAQ